ncbi:MAG: FAD-binding protein, partial [Dehalococcoidia bacterium]|nr:FAD-binding protein [Dehalococcoidia bacterium]
MKSYDYIIVGSGIAGLYAALLAREHGSVLVITKGSVDDCNTRWAQGGIAAPIGPGDSPQKHLDDTIAAGAGLVDSEAARVLHAGGDSTGAHLELTLSTHAQHTTHPVLDYTLATEILLDSQVDVGA